MVMQWSASETLVEVDKSTVSRESALGYIVDWATDATSSSSALTFEKQGEDGVILSFTMAKENYIAVDVCKSNSTSTVVTLAVNLPSLQNSGDVAGLIQSSAIILVDSLREDIIVLCQNGLEGAVAGARVAVDAGTDANSKPPSLDIENLRRPSVLFSAKDEREGRVGGDDLVEAVRTTVRDWAQSLGSSGIGIQARSNPSGAELVFSTSFSTSWQLAVHCTQEGEVRVVSTMSAATNKPSDWETIASVQRKLAGQLVTGLETIDLSARVLEKNENDYSFTDSGVGTGAGDWMPPAPSKNKKRQSIEAPVPQRQRDTKLEETAKDLNLNLESFEGRGLEEQAIEQLNAMVENSKSAPFLDIIRRSRNADLGAQEKETEEGELTIAQLFEKGAQISEKSWQNMLDRANQEKYPESVEDLKRPPTKFPMNLKEVGLEKGVDIFEGPDGDSERLAPKSSLAGQLESLVNKNKPPRPADLPEDERKLQLLTSELARTDPDMYGEVLSAYKDVLLCDNLLFMLNRANSTCVDDDERDVLGLVADSATAITIELGMLVKTESVRHLQTIHDICDVAFALQQDEAAFLSKMDLIKPRFDTALLGYLNFAIGEEEVLSARKGVPTVWLQVLTIVRQGVMEEFERRYDRLLEPLLLHVRFDDVNLRRDLFRRFVNMVQPLELRYMKELATNMASRILEQASMGESFPDPLLPQKMEQLLGDVELFLDEAKIDAMVEAFVDKAREQGTEVVLTHRNPVIQDEMETQALLMEREEKRRRDEAVGASILDTRAHSKREEECSDRE